MPTFACPQCQRKLKVKDELAGRRIKCPHCGQAVHVPEAAASHASSADERTLPPRPGATPAPEPRNAAGREAANDTQSFADSVSGASGKASRGELTDFLAPPQAPDELGRLGPYRVLQVLGAGGMGVVYRAEDPALQRPIALKAMLPGLATSESSRERFLREARSAAAINHDNIVNIYQVGEDRGVPFLAMQFLQGEPLDERLKRQGKLPVAEVLRIGRETALGLAAAHKRGLIHRDIKPANLWLEAETDRVKILDFGLARAAGGESHLTQTGAIVGTPAYMAPEQAAGRELDARCDLFSLGCVLYRLATGQAPFKGTDTISTLMAVATEQPKPPRELDRAVPPALSDLILRLLAKKPADRPATAQAVVEAVRALESDRTAQLVPQPGPTTKKKAQQKHTERAAAGNGRRRLWMLLGAGGGVLALGLLILLVLRPWTRSQPTQEPPPPGPDAKAAEGTVDLLPLIDPMRDTVKGSWTFNGVHTLTSGPRSEGNSLVMIPYTPPKAYQLDVLAERKTNEGAGLNLGIVTPAGQSVVVIDGFDGQTTGLETVDGKLGKNNETTYKGQLLPLGRPTTLQLQVWPKRVKFLCDGKTIFSWHGVPRRLGLVPMWQVPDTHRLFLGSQARFDITRLTLTPLKTTTTETEWLPLFNGKDLTGWKTHPQQAYGWTVEDGQLIGRAAEGPTHLFSERGDFANFHLRAEVAVNDRGNSGIYFRTPFDVSRSGRYPGGYEAQILHRYNTDAHLTGSLQGLAKAPRLNLAPDQWFTLEILAVDNDLTIKVDGQTTVHYVDDARRAMRGRFALQAMDPRSTVVRFRTIEVKEIPLTTP